MDFSKSSQNLRANELLTKSKTMAWSPPRLRRLTYSSAVRPCQGLVLEINCGVRLCLFYGAVAVRLIREYIVEFAVADIKDIQWSSSPFDCLTIPNEQKEVIIALAETRSTAQASLKVYTIDLMTDEFKMFVHFLLLAFDIRWYRT